MSEPMVTLAGVGKRYVKYDDAPMLVNALRFRQRTRRSELWAVRDVDLRVGEGESVGIVGRNGAGKSTLLQLLCGVTAPTTGRVAVRGRVAPLISVGVGFHPELTGRENVHLNGTILGMTKAEIDRKFDAIVDFAEVEDFIDTPVKFYSSGMFVRLGFAVAVAADPAVLLVDEVLAVGDFAFQRKCFDRMRQIREQGATVIVVSHNLNVLRGFCDRGVVMSQGEKVFDGATFDAISAYYEVIGQAAADERAAAGGSTGSVATVDVLSLHVGPDEHATRHVSTGDTITFRIGVTARHDLASPFLGLTIASESGVVVYSDTNRLTPFSPMAAGTSSHYDVTLSVPLVSGGYVVTSSLHSHGEPEGRTLLDRAVPLTFYVSGHEMVSGVADLGAAFVEPSA